VTARKTVHGARKIPAPTNSHGIQRGICCGGGDEAAMRGFLHFPE
jgi:hypothetical protein